MTFQRIKKTLEESQGSDHRANKHEWAYEKHETIKD